MMAGSLSILVLEDSDEDFDTVEEAIRQSALQIFVHRAANGDECIDLLRKSDQHHSTLILMDLNTPGTDGRTALEQIKTDPRLKHFPVVIFSTSANPKDIAYCYEVGANAYHIKPVRYTDHLRTITDVLRYWFAHAALPEFKSGRL